MGTVPLPPRKSYTCINFDRKGTEIVHLWFHQMKRRAAPLQPPEIIYSCKFRPKRARNYAYLACKIQNFLRQGGTAPEIVHLWFPKYTFSYMKRRAAPCNHQILYISVNWNQKLPENYAYLACKIQNFLRQGGAAPLQPPKIVYTYKDSPRPCDHQKLYISFKKRRSASLQPPNHIVL